MGIMILFLVLSVSFIIFVVLYMKFAAPEAKAKRKRMQKAKEGGQADQEISLSQKEISEIKKMWEIVDIKNGVIKLSGNRYRMILSMGSMDFHLMSQEEQNVIETQLMQAALSFQFPTQYFTTTERVDTHATIEAVNKVCDNEDLNPKICSYAHKMKVYLNDIMETRGVYVRKSYAVVCVDDEIDEEKAINEVQRRTGIFLNAMGRARILCTPLNTLGIIDLLHRELNKESPVKPSEVISKGGMELYVTGLGVIGEVNNLPSIDAGTQ